jgi:sulfane dehydrogenase subunit SoxC
MIRRNLLRAAAALAGAPIARAIASPSAAVPAWSKTQGAPIADDHYGTPSAFESHVVRRPREKLLFDTAGSIVTPLQDLDGIITPNGLHYIRSHAGTPAIDPDQHRLMIHGLVDRPLSLSMDDLMRFPSVSAIHFLECSGNTALYKQANIKPGLTVQDTHGLLSCAEWTGVRLADVLAEAGVQPDATWMLAEGADACAMSRSIPVAKAMQDAILAFSQNGERLRPEQGYPLRLLLPGYEGNTNIKWLRRLKLGDQPFESREETSKYTDLGRDGKALQFNFIMRVKSVITRPSPGFVLKQTGYHEITGLAWSGNGRITRVEVSADDGATWTDAALQGPVMSRSLTRFRLPWSWNGGPAVLQSRATDETGAVQPTRASVLSERGPNFYYHYDAITSWRLAPDGNFALAV